MGVHYTERCHRAWLDLVPNWTHLVPWPLDNLISELRQVSDCADAPELGSLLFFPNAIVLISLRFN